MSGLPVVLPVDGLLAKVRRAYANVRIFDRTYVSTPEGQMPLISLGKNFDPTDHTYVITVSDVKAVPLDGLLAVDEAAHHLRSALDHLVFALSLLDSGKEQWSTQFPMLSKPRHWDKGEEGKRTQNVWLKGVSAAHRQAIEKHQPYHPWIYRDLRRSHPLSLLNDLNNDNKHRFLQAAFVMLNAIRLSPRNEIDCYVSTDWVQKRVFNPDMLNRPLYPEMELARVPVVITGPKHQLDVSYRAASYLGFRNGMGFGNLRTVAAYVRRIIREFAPDLSDPKMVALWETIEGRFKVRTESKAVYVVYPQEP